MSICYETIFPIGMFHFAPGAVPDLLYILYLWKTSWQTQTQGDKRYDFIIKNKHLYCVQLNKGRGKQKHRTYFYIFLNAGRVLIKIVCEMHYNNKPLYAVFV